MTTVTVTVEKAVIATTTTETGQVTYGNRRSTLSESWFPK